MLLAASYVGREYHLRWGMYTPNSGTLEAEARGSRVLKAACTII